MPLKPIPVKMERAKRNGFMCFEDGTKDREGARPHSAADPASRRLRGNCPLLGEKRTSVFEAPARPLDDFFHNNWFANPGRVFVPWIVDKISGYGNVCP
jgi:hypothetical protein